MKGGCLAGVPFLSRTRQAKPRQRHPQHVRRPGNPPPSDRLPWPKARCHVTRKSGERLPNNSSHGIGQAIPRSGANESRREAHRLRTRIPVTSPTDPRGFRPVKPSLAPRKPATHMTRDRDTQRGAGSGRDMPCRAHRWRAFTNMFKKTRRLRQFPLHCEE